MSQIIRAVYTQGVLQPLDPVEFMEGEEVQLTLVSSRDSVKEALADLIVVPIGPSEDEVNAIDQAALMQRIEKAFQGQRPLSEDIIEERRNGP
jgi:predicted DNA-binding antitoxin AbrB/MazE fold protein